jgi:adenylate kinase family enzyme
MSKKIKEIVSNSDFVKMYTSELSDDEKKILSEYNENITQTLQHVVDFYRSKAVTTDGQREIQEDMNELMGFPREGWGEPDEEVSWDKSDKSKEE